MNIFNSQTIENSDDINRFLSELSDCINKNIKSQLNYKDLLFKFIPHFVNYSELNSSASDTSSNKIVSMLENLNNNISLATNNVAELNELLEKIHSLNSPYSVDELNNIYSIYNKVCFKIVNDNIEIENLLLSAMAYLSQNLSVALLGKNIENTHKNEITSCNSSIVTNTPNTDIENTNADPAEETVKACTELSYPENTLIISELQGKVFLPYSFSVLDNILENNVGKYSNYTEIIDSEFILPISNYKNPMLSRFAEAYKLIKHTEKGSTKEAFDLGMELIFNYNLHPAIITACKSLDELDIYLDYLNSNETEKFNCFEIKYEVPPVIYKKAKKI